MRPADRALLRRVPLFATVADAALDALPVGTRRLAAGEVLFRRGEPGATAYVVAQGRVKISGDGRSGRELLLALVEPGALFGELALLDGQPRSATAAALAPTRLLTLHRRDVLALLRAHPDAALGLLGELAARVRRLNDSLEQRGALGLPARLARKLLELGDRAGELSQQELGDAVGVTRESVNKRLAAFAEAGLLALRRGRVTLLDRDGLAAVARDAPPE
jgi:CRP/FNR family cyclic AMP-dependent transcriptional regulator